MGDVGDQTRPGVPPDLSSTPPVRETTEPSSPGAIRVIPIKRYVWAFALLWTSAIGALLWVNVSATKESALNAARAEARGIFSKYLVYMQPAYMTREFHQVGADQEHITSLKPRSPENAPDPWETSALRAFEAGAPERSSVEMANGEPILRYMAPVRMLKTCLQCHADQGYKLEDVCGGLSVRVALRPQLAAARVHLGIAILGYGALWILGLCGLGFSARSLQDRIAQARRAEAALREQEQKYKVLYENLGVGVAMIGPDMEVLALNRRMREWFPEIDLSQRPTCHLALNFIPRDEACSGCPTKRTLEDGQRHDGEVEKPGPDGTKYYRIVSSPLTDPEGRVTAAVEVVDDITERKRAEKLLTYVMKAVESTSEAIGISDAQGHHFYQNKSSSDLFEYATAEELEAAGGGPAVIKDPKVARDMFGSIMQGKPWVGELEMVTKTGRVFQAYERADAIKDNDGNIVGLIGVISDITERKRAEEALRTLHAELEQRVRERTSALTEANRELESFSYSVSHDLRAPVRAIDGFAKLLEEQSAGSLDDEGRRLLATVRKNSLRMGRLIDDLLTFSRAGRSELRRGEIDVARLVSEVLAEVLPGERREQVEVRVGELPVAQGDWALIRQVIVNLLQNAVKFSSPRAKPVVEIGSQRTEGAVEYFVRDNGVGFDQKYAGKLFGVFQRLHSEREFSGTGIGLSLVRRIVERHGGCVRAEGAVGKGATFYFTLGPASKGGQVTGALDGQGRA